MFAFHNFWGAAFPQFFEKIILLFELVFEKFFLSLLRDNVWLLRTIQFHNKSRWAAASVDISILVPELQNLAEIGVLFDPISEFLSFRTGARHLGTAGAESYTSRAKAFDATHVQSMWAFFNRDWFKRTHKPWIIKWCRWTTLVIITKVNIDIRFNGWMILQEYSWFLKYVFL